MKTTPAALAALLLAACQPQDPEGKPAPPPADAPAAAAPAGTTMDISKPITARGTEPFWALTIDGKAFRLTRPGQPDLTAEAPGASISEGRAIWIAKTADGRQMTVTLYASQCSDGMSDLAYPMSAEVVMLNEELRGCAAKATELPREGG
ncbi:MULTISPECIES: COG3650 family protein [unclassified Phenylobacterium]|uniref:COG3650 family protein n=1 Tax=unclassified Phenylobacterium TaxID=2640670 RepID=UPI0012E7CF54|nr:MULTISPECIES: hypothetical protein [unclassified Phenylobacterium]